MDLSYFCDECGAAVPTEAKACPVCGNSIHPSASTQTSHSTPPAHILIAQTITPPVSVPQPQAITPQLQRYRLLKKIGEGGFGAVYKAWDRKRLRMVAIKQITLATLSTREIIEATDSYNRETTILPQLKHKHIPRLYEHFTDHQHWYLVMEYIKGQTLEELLAHSPHGHLPIDQIVNIGLQLCEVLDYLHRQDPPIIFRDLKPANIMITKQGHIYLIDFGIARRYRADQKKDTIPLGTPGYAAPEQYGKSKMQSTSRTDMYALGATLQTLLTGREPLDIRLHGLPTDCDIPDELQQLIKWIMKRDLYKRPKSLYTVEKTLLSIANQQDEQRKSPDDTFILWLLGIICYTGLWATFVILINMVCFRLSPGIFFSECIVILLATLLYSGYFLSARLKQPYKLTHQELLTNLQKNLLPFSLFTLFISLYSIIYIGFTTKMSNIELRIYIYIALLMVCAFVIVAIRRYNASQLKAIQTKQQARQARQAKKIIPYTPLQQQAQTIPAMDNTSKEGIQYNQSEELDTLLEKDEE